MSLRGELLFEADRMELNPGWMDTDARSIGITCTRELLGPGTDATNGAIGGIATNGAIGYYTARDERARAARARVVVAGES